jgi:hypothetical protein
MYEVPYGIQRVCRVFSPQRAQFEDDPFPHLAMDQRIPFDPIELETIDESGVHSGSALNRARDERRIAPYLIEVFSARCEQGAFICEGEVFAKSGRTVLFVSASTHQFGVGDAAEGDDQRILGCYQNLSLEAAILMFFNHACEVSPSSSNLR